MSTRGGATRRATRWHDTIIVQSVATGATEELTLIAGIPDDEGQTVGLTLIRTIVSLTFLPSAAVAGFGQQLMTLGIGVVQQDAFIGTALPDLGVTFEEPHGGWVFKEAGVVGAQPGEEELSAGWRLHGDYRSMRKLGGDAEVYLQLQNTAVVGTAFTVQVAGLIRCLYKLP